MSSSNARSLLAEASEEKDRLRRHLLVAAALNEVLASEPVVVGGTAEEFWTDAEYHETDLDLCVSLRPRDVKAIEALGFKKDGRHWVYRDIAVEFPESVLDGDVQRTHVEKVAKGSVRIIGVDDLYVDRLRQATAREGVEGVEYQSAVAVATAGYRNIDWRYVRRRIDAEDELVGESMKRIDAQIRRRLRRALG